MKSHPYFGITQSVADVSKKLIRESDEYHKVHAARLTRTAELLVQNAGDATKLLELGTSGYFPLVCKELLSNITVDATHFDESNPEDCSVTMTLGGQSIDVRAFNLDLEFGKLPVADGSYDIVLCCEVLEHMEIDPMHMLSEVNRVLRDGGTLILTTPNITSSRALHKILQGVEPYFFMQYHKTREYHRHNYEYSAPALVRLLTAAGFSGRVWSEDLFEEGLPAIVKTLKSHGFAVEHHGDNLLSVATKISGIVDRYPHGIYV
jgi:SAM-dependent methyltransferase